MRDINKIIGNNLLKLRKNAKLTQLELAEKFNYSDKSISKWESGESLPNIEVLYDLATFYNVTLDSLTREENIIVAQKDKSTRERRYSSHTIITLLSVCAVWFLATMLFVLLKITIGIDYTIAFMWALPISCIVLLVFNSIWGKSSFLAPILTIMLWSILACIHIQLLMFGINAWPIYFIGIPLQLSIALWDALLKKPKKKKDKQIETITQNS